jgi:hypothetical protein
MVCSTGRTRRSCAKIGSGPAHQSLAKYKMTISSAKNNRTITATEVQEWVGKSSKSVMGKAQFGEIAAGLTRFKWPADPPPPPGSPWVTKEIEPDPNRWWDFEAVTEAAKTLLKNAPAMLSHWEGQRWASETRGGFDVIKTLGDALFFAMPYIEWPLGYYDRKAPRMRLKAWHTMALVIARLVIKVTIDAGHNEPGITRNSIVVRIVRNALIRMNFPNAKMITTTAIGAHLTRWNNKFGLTPTGIGALTTKQFANICDHALPNVADYPLSSDIVAWRREWLRQIERVQGDNCTRRETR